MVYWFYTTAEEVYNKLNRLKEIRESKEMTQTALAKVSGISRQRINQLEKGTFLSVNSKTLRALADALGVNIADLFSE